MGCYKKIKKVNSLQNKQRSGESEINSTRKKYEEAKGKKFTILPKEVYLSHISYVEGQCKIYRDKSNKLIKSIEKVDPKLAKKLYKKYSGPLNKTYIGDFTIKELKNIQKNPNNLSDKAKKYFDQEFKLKVGKQRLSDISNFANRQIQQQVQQQVQQQIHQQMHQQIQQQIMQTHHMMF